MTLRIKITQEFYNYIGTSWHERKKKTENKDKELFSKGQVSTVSFYFAKNIFSYYNTEKLEIGINLITESRVEKREEIKDKAIIICNNFRFTEKLKRY